MNRNTLRAFAAGMFVTVCLIGAFYYLNEENTPEDAAPAITEAEAKAFLEAKDFSVMTNDELSALRRQLAEEEKKKEPPTPSAPEKPEPKETKETNLAYQLEIKSGMLSHEIADMLANEKIVDDADQFEAYLEDNGYSKRIQLGTFELEANMSYKEIAKIITKTH